MIQDASLGAGICQRNIWHSAPLSEYSAIGTHLLPCLGVDRCQMLEAHAAKSQSAQKGFEECSATHIRAQQCVDWWREKEAMNSGCGGANI